MNVTGLRGWLGNPREQRVAIYVTLLIPLSLLKFLPSVFRNNNKLFTEYSVDLYVSWEFAHATERHEKKSGLR